MQNVSLHINGTLRIHFIVIVEVYLRNKDGLSDIAPLN